MAVLKQIKFGSTSTPIAKTVVQGKPEGVISVTNTSGFNNKDSEEKDYSYDIDVNVDNATIVKSSGSLAVGTVPAAKVSVAAIQGIDATDAQAAFQELKEEIDNVGGAAKSYKIVEVDEPASTSQAEYKIQEKIGEGNWTDVKGSSPIVVPKDNAFITAQLGHTGATVDQETGAITDGADTGAEVLLIEYKNGEGTYTLVEIPVGDFLRESEFKDGLQVNGGEVSAKLGNGIEFGNEATGNKSLNVKIDSTSETFLTVGADGVKLAGVQDAINAKVAALDFTDTPVDSQYVTKVDETDGVVSVERADVSAAKLNNYAKGETKPQSTDIAATDTINQAFAKIEFKIDDNEKTTAASLTDLDNRIKAMDKTASAVDGQVVTTVAEADGVVSETKANVKDLQLGGYAKDASATGAIGGTDTINTALSKLENQIDAAKAAATTKVAKDTNASHLTVTQSAPAADGSVTYTIGESDIASKTDLDAEIAARKAVDGQDGQTYAANTTANYINNATSLNDADVKLDTAIKAEETRAKAAEAEIANKVGLTGAEGSRTFTPTTNYGGTDTSAATSVIDNMQKIDDALKAVSDKANAIQYKVNGTTLEFYGMTEKTGA